MTKIIDGKRLSGEVQTHLKEEVIALKQRGVTPGLAVIIVGNDSASHVYVKNKRKACKEIGVESFAHDLSAKTTEQKLLELLAQLNADRRVHGILVQLPLPKHIDTNKIIHAIDPEKDVDGFHPDNVGKLILGQPCPCPCTPQAVMEMIESVSPDITGKHAVVVGRSNIVGKPTAFLLLERSATVTICHSRTKDLAAQVGTADILVAAIGKPNFIKGSWIKRGAVVIDVGINRLETGKLVGDVEFDVAKERAGAITPVPGGVGPMTIAMLLKNVVHLCRSAM